MVTCLLSLFLFLIEQTFFFKREIIYDLLQFLGQDDPLTPMRILLIISTIMSYMIYVCFIGVFSAKVLGYYEFYQGHTSPSTLLNSAFYILKFAPPICFNLLDIALGRSAMHEKTAFYNSIGNLRIVPLLGLPLPKVFANLLIIVVIFFMCGILRKIKKLLGYPVYEFSTRMNNLMVIEGKKIISAERKTLLEEIALKSIDLDDTLVCSTDLVSYQVHSVQDRARPPVRGYSVLQSHFDSNRHRIPRVL